MLIMAMSLTTTLLAILLVMVCAGSLAYVLFSGKDRSQDEVQRRLSGLMGGSFSGPLQDGSSAGQLVRARATSPLLSRLGLLTGRLEKKQSDYERSALSLKLAQAGYRQEGIVALFLASRLVLGAIGAMIGVGYALQAQYTGTDVMSAVVIAGIGGFFIPKIWLGLMCRQRSEAIERALPDSLDMLVVAVEAGLGLDSAIQRVGIEMKRSYAELAEEWTIAARETQMGIPRGEAMRKMAQRCNCGDMQALVAILTQAEKFGTSIAQALRTHADCMRVKRRQRAEERAAKTSLKLLFPLMLFLFPVIFVVILGPAVIRVLSNIG